MYVVKNKNKEDKKGLIMLPLPLYLVGLVYCIALAFYIT